MYHFLGPTEREPEKTEQAKAESVLMKLLSCPFCGSMIIKVFCICGHQMYEHSPFDSHHCWLCECQEFAKRNG